MLATPFLIMVGWIVAASPDTAAAAQQEVTPAEMRQAIERALPFTLQASVAWRENRDCVTCHQVPFTLWSHHEARRRGFQTDEKQVDDLSAWALNFCTTNEHEGKRTGGFMSTMPKMMLAHEAAPKTEATIAAFSSLLPILVGYQTDDGCWKDGNRIRVTGAELEGDQVDTMWTVLGLTALEKSAEQLSTEARTALVDGRAKALVWLKEAKPATRTDWLALELLIQQAFGEPGLEANYRQALLDRQNAEGAWPFVAGGEGHAIVTGECLYALCRAGLTFDDAPVRRAVAYLVHGQSPDGSWSAISRQDLGKDPKSTKINEINIHWATNWALIGLLRALPQPDAASPQKPAAAR